VWLPPGTYNHSGKITLDSVAMTGAGEKSVLNATNPNSGAITLTGNNPSLSNIQSVSAKATDRSSMPDAANVLVQNASGATVSNMKIIGAASNGIRLDGASNSTISKNLVTGTNADGIALMNGSTGNMVQSNVVNQASDDSYSDDSYTSDAKQDEGNTFDSNVSMANAYGRGIVLAGSKNDKVTNNIVSGSKWYGIFADSDPNSGTMASSGHTISGNTVINNPNGAPVQASSPGTKVSGTKTDGNIPDLASVLGWDPGDIPDRTKITGYTPGTGSGANNSGGNRS
jgi:parallel beta-helix repeat protein